MAERKIPVQFYPDQIVEESRAEREQLAEAHRNNHASLIDRRHDAVSKLDNFSSMIIGPIITVVLGLASNQSPILVVIAIGLLNAMMPIVGFIRGNDIIFLDDKVADDQETCAQDEFFAIYKNTPLAMLAEFRFRPTGSFYGFVRRTVSTSTLVNSSFALIISGAVLQMHATDISIIAALLTTEVLVTIVATIVGIRLLKRPSRTDQSFPYPMIALHRGRVVHCRVRFICTDDSSTVKVRYNWRTNTRIIVDSDTTGKDELIEEWLEVEASEVKVYGLPPMLKHLERAYNRYVIELHTAETALPATQEVHTEPSPVISHY
jgi:hypothetical protein